MGLPRELSIAKQGDTLMNGGLGREEERERDGKWNRGQGCESKRQQEECGVYSQAEQL